MTRAPGTFGSPWASRLSRARWRRLAVKAAAEAATGTQHSEANRASPAARHASLAPATTVADTLSAPNTAGSTAPIRETAPRPSTARTRPIRLPGMPRPISVPTAARPAASPSACQSKIAATGDRRGQLADTRAEAPSTLPMATTASSAVSASPCISFAVTFEYFQRFAQRLGLDSGDRLGETGQCGSTVAGLVERGQHQLGDVGLPGRGRAITPGTTVALPPGESLFREPVEYRHHGGVS